MDDEDLTYTETLPTIVINGIKFVLIARYQKESGRTIVQIQSIIPFGNVEHITDFFVYRSNSEMGQFRLCAENSVWVGPPQRSRPVCVIRTKQGREGQSPQFL